MVQCTLHAQGAKDAALAQMKLSLAPGMQEMDDIATLITAGSTEAQRTAALGEAQAAAAHITALPDKVQKNRCTPCLLICSVHPCVAALLLLLGVYVLWAIDAVPHPSLQCKHQSDKARPSTCCYLQLYAEYSIIFF